MSLPQVQLLSSWLVLDTVASGYSGIVLFTEEHSFFCFEKKPFRQGIESYAPKAALFAKQNVFFHYNVLSF